MRKLIQISSTLILAGLFSSAQALNAPPSADIRCLIVGSVMSNSTDATQRNAGNMLAIYVIGLLSAFSALEIEDAMVSEGVTLTPAQIQTETLRCGAVLQEKGQMMQQIGKNILRRSQEMNQNATSTAVPPNK
jgi:hypothetical protein